MTALELARLVADRWCGVENVGRGSEARVVLRVVSLVRRARETKRRPFVFQGERTPLLADCHPPIPTLWLGDGLDQPGGLIPVKGFASTFANLLQALKVQRQGKLPLPQADSLWGRPIPRPLPARGGKMRVTGVMGRSFALSSGSVDFDPDGMLTYASSEYVEPPPAPAALGR